MIGEDAAGRSRAPPDNGGTGDRVAAAGGADLAALRADGDRGAAMTAMGRGAAAVVTELHAQGRLDAVLSAAGSGNSSIAAAAMAALPIGVPKLLVSTMASGDVSPYVGAKDVTIMYSVVDVAGVNGISRTILGNAAAAAAAMAGAHRARIQATGPTEVFWPDLGVSALDADGLPFADPAADAACLAALQNGLAASNVAVHRRDEHINDPAFAEAMADRLHELISGQIEGDN